VTLSEKLQARLDANREAQAPEAPRKCNDPFFLSGLALGLSASIAAFTFGVNHPTNDLPQTPDWRSKVSHVSRSELGEPIPAASQAPAAPVKAAKAERTSRAPVSDWDELDCRHYLKAAKSYMMAAKYDKAKAEIRKAEKEGCPTNVSFF